MSTPEKLQVDTITGHITGPANIKYNSPFPCVNGSWGSGAMSGVLMHTMVGDLPGTVQVFNDPSFQASAHFGISQDGEIWQFGPIGKGWIAWHAVSANRQWYGIEHADAGNPDNPLTPQQIAASAQLVELLSRFAGFPLQVTDSPSGRGYGTHNMGGQAWGGHTCPDLPPNHVRSAQRAGIIALAGQIRNPAPAPHGPYRHVADGTLSLAQIARQRNTTVQHLVEVTAGALKPADLAAIAAVLDGAMNTPLPKGFVFYTTNP
jgi:hypothetical protein